MSADVWLIILSHACVSYDVYVTYETLFPNGCCLGTFVLSSVLNTCVSLQRNRCSCFIMMGDYDKVRCLYVCAYVLQSLLFKDVSG